MSVSSCDVKDSKFDTSCLNCTGLYFSSLQLGHSANYCVLHLLLRNKGTC